jgi:hypothetical protein
MPIEQSQSSGLVVIEVRDIAGELKVRRVAKNLITDIGDEYHVRRIAAGVAPAAPGQPSGLVTGMKLGTGVTAAAKNGAGAALVTYLAGANRVLDAGFPTVESLGAAAGWTVTYQCQFAAGVATHGALTEVALVTDAAVDATSAAAATISRVVFAATPKSATDVLTIAWAHKQLGA